MTLLYPCVVYSIPKQTSDERERISDVLVSLTSELKQGSENDHPEVSLDEALQSTNATWKRVGHVRVEILDSKAILQITRNQLVEICRFKSDAKETARNPMGTNTEDDISTSPPVTVLTNTATVVNDGATQNNTDNAEAKQVTDVSDAKERKI